MPGPSYDGEVQTRTNLNAGLDVIKRFAQDYPAWVVNARDMRECGLTGGTWLDWATEELARWRAWRPMSKADGKDNLRECASDLQDQVDAILQRCGQAEPTFETVEWRHLSGLFAIAFSIKSTASHSPVFASKLCHFIFPAAFPVVDGELLGGAASYPVYWHGCRGLWLECEEKDALKRVVAEEIGINLLDDFPWATKTVEWCLIGERARLPKAKAERHGS
jgi:hypothetical protein